MDDVLASLDQSACDEVDALVRQEYKLLRWASLDVMQAVHDGSLAARNYSDYLRLKVVETSRAQLHLEYRLRQDPETAPVQHAD